MHKSVIVLYFCYRYALAEYDAVDCLPKDRLLSDSMGRVYLQLCGGSGLLLQFLQLAGRAVPSTSFCILCDNYLTERRLPWTISFIGWHLKVWFCWGGSSCHSWGHSAWYVTAEFSALIGILKLLLFLIPWNVHFSALPFIVTVFP
jgi:hypothetical protein